MRSTLLVMTLGSIIAASGGGAAIAQTMAGAAPEMPGRAPIGHLQPRAQPLSPQSEAEQAEQQKMDADLDKRLNICRRC